ncbi:HAD family hydrolase [Mongoliitalea daihaiensis]|uniref:HAD family hydrolase n=1 Tax=Mongoliitalea daihaiensis TaxID=2782006 RepID=UPI001F41C815|nr:HAD-IA family hydrolase [Mongoliitalea daihaiensis]UJP64469.1 HAD family hydrolase [Mongoliitalea daihaiensis]
MIKVIFWDFDGVLMDSNSIRDLGFEHVLAEFPKEEVDQLLAFHQANGGLSRYVKFRYFFEEIRKKSISDSDILIWAERFSLIMKELLVNPELLMEETLNFVKENQGEYIMHITSGSDQNELRFLCESMGIDNLFTSIHGSPKPKKEWVKELIEMHGYKKEECVLIGDSYNDYEAANSSNIHFMAYNNAKLEALTSIEPLF